MTDDRVRALVRVPSLEAWLHFHRLTYLASFIRVDVPEAWGLVHAERLWLLDVQASLAWLFGLVDGPEGATAWHAAWESWRDTIVRRPGAWKGMLRRALCRAARREVLAEAWQQCRGLMAKQLLQAGASLRSACDADQTGGFFCGPCGLRFRTKQQWSVHAFRTHGLVKATRRFTDGTQCPCCLRQYPSNISLCSHIGYSLRCRLYLVRQGFSCAPCPGVGNKAADSGRDFLETVRQGFGPFPCEAAAAEEVDPGVEAGQQSGAVWAALEAALWDMASCSTFAILLEAYRRAFCAA